LKTKKKTTPSGKPLGVQGPGSQVFLAPRYLRENLVVGIPPARVGNRTDVHAPVAVVRVPVRAKRPRRAVIVNDIRDCSHARQRGAGLPGRLVIRLFSQKVNGTKTFILSHPKRLTG